MQHTHNCFATISLLCADKESAPWTLDHIPKSVWAEDGASAVEEEHDNRGGWWFRVGFRFGGFCYISTHSAHIVHKQAPKFMGWLWEVVWLGRWGPR